MTGYDVLINHEVTRLCHFTKFQSLTHILASEDGIISSESIRQDTKNVTDQERYDGELDYVCCSVQYPNSWFLSIAKSKNKDKVFSDWVVMYINPIILNIRKAKFSPCNASKQFGAHIENDISKLENIFAYRLPTFQYPRTPSMLNSCPTDGQAEILIENSIPRDYIFAIAVGSQEMAARVYALLKVYNLKNIDIYIAPDVLSTNWSSMIKKGEKPTEEEFIVMEGN